jgi:NAD(P)-dependent dehydrogenase (short-subunit alcohol dehydrogenase family)
MSQGKSALVTGSLGGIGFVSAKALAEPGCDVMLNGFGDADTIAARVHEIAATGARAATITPIRATRRKSRPWSRPPRAPMAPRHSDQQRRRSLLQRGGEFRARTLG